MSLALSNTKSEKDISFNKKSLVSLDNKQVSSGKSYTPEAIKAFINIANVIGLDVDL